MLFTYSLIPHDNEIIIIYDSDKIVKYYYYNDYKILESFDPGIRLYKW